MQITPQQWERVQTIVRELPEKKRDAFSEVRTQDIRTLFIPEDQLVPERLDQTRITRRALREIFSHEQVWDRSTQELLARLLIMGKILIFQGIEGIEDPIVIAKNGEIPENELLEEDPFGDMNNMIPPPATEMRSFRGVAVPAVHRDNAIRHWVVPHWDLQELLAILEQFEPFSHQMAELQNELLFEPPAQWKKSHTRDGLAATARANRKGNLKFCEDQAFADRIESNTGGNFFIGAALDGVSMKVPEVFSDNICKWLFNLLIISCLRKQFSKKLAFQKQLPPAEEVKALVQEALLAAQFNMKNLLPLIAPCLRLDLQSLSTTGDRGREEGLKKMIGAVGDEHLFQELFRNDYLLRYSGATTLEFVLIDEKNGQGLNFRIGDGMTFLAKKSGNLIPIGPQNKRSDQLTAAIGIFKTPDKIHKAIQITPFQIEKGDALLITTDGLADNLERIFGEKNLEEGLLDILLNSSNAEQAVSELCLSIDHVPLKKPDDVGFVVIKNAHFDCARS